MARPAESVCPAGVDDRRSAPDWSRLVAQRKRVGMWSLRQACWLSASVMIAGAAVALVMPTVGSAQPGSAANRFEAGIRPGRIGEIDCNGLSPIQRPVKANLVCADSRGPYD